MLRRNVDRHGFIYDCCLTGVSQYGNPVVIVTSSKYPQADWNVCAIPTNWEWIDRT